jgi:hypothetical protein
MAVILKKSSTVICFPATDFSISSRCAKEVAWLGHISPSFLVFLLHHPHNTLPTLHPITFYLPRAVRIKASIVNKTRSKLIDHIKMKSKFSSFHIMKNTCVNFWNCSLFYPSCVLFIHVVYMEIVCMNGILQLCPHISLPHPASFFSY